MATTSASDDLVAFFDDLVRCETRLYNSVGEKLRTENGIAAAPFEFLRYLRAHPDSRVADIAANYAVGIGAISKMMDRLDTSGWVTRVPNPADRRSSLLRLTRSGAALVDKAETTFVAHLDELITPAVSTDEIRAAAAILARLRAALEQGRVGLPVG
jgi:MarR family multiple antibiotic resistance transcriptional regulator